MKKFEIGKRYYSQTAWGKFDIEIVKRGEKTIVIFDKSGVFASSDLEVRKKIKFDKKSNCEIIEFHNKIYKSTQIVDEVELASREKKIKTSVKSSKKTTNTGEFIQYTSEEWNRIKPVSLIDALYG